MLGTHRVLDLGGVGWKVQGEGLGEEMRLRVGRNERVTMVRMGRGRMARNQGVGRGGSIRDGGEEGREWGEGGIRERGVGWMRESGWGGRSG